MESHSKPKVILLIWGTFILCIASIPFYYGLNEGWSPDRTQFSVQYAGVIISSISLIIISITIRFQSQEIEMQKKQLEKSLKISADTYNSLVLSLVKELQSSPTEDMRKNASYIREYLRTSDCKEFKNILYKVVTDDWGTPEEYTKLIQSEFYQQFHAFTSLARYFDMMSYYEFNEITAKSIHFYYCWWRGSFIIYRDMYNETYEKAHKRELSFQPNFIGMCDRVDYHMKKHNLPLH